MLLYFTVMKTSKANPSSSTAMLEILNTYCHDHTGTGKTEVKLFMKVIQNSDFTAFSAICQLFDS